MALTFMSYNPHRDELCGNGSILSSRALNFKERQLNETLIKQANVIERGVKDEELEDTNDGITEDEDSKVSISLKIRNQVTIF